MKKFLLMSVLVMGASAMADEKMGRFDPTAGTPYEFGVNPAWHLYPHETFLLKVKTDDAPIVKFKSLSSSVVRPEKDPCEYKEPTPYCSITVGVTVGYLNTEITQNNAAETLITGSNVPLEMEAEYTSPLNADGSCSAGMPNGTLLNLRPSGYAEVSFQNSEHQTIKGSFMLDGNFRLTWNSNPTALKVEGSFTSSRWFSELTDANIKYRGGLDLVTPAVFRAPPVARSAGHYGEDDRDPCDYDGH